MQLLDELHVKGAAGGRREAHLAHEPLKQLLPGKKGGGCHLLYRVLARSSVGHNPARTEHVVDFEAELTERRWALQLGRAYGHTSWSRAGVTVLRPVSRSLGGRHPREIRKMPATTAPSASAPAARRLPDCILAASLSASTISSSSCR
jgi:hypothetical protein